MTFEAPEKRKKLLVSMGILAAIVVGTGLGTMTITGYLRSQDRSTSASTTRQSSRTRCQFLSP